MQNLFGVTGRIRTDDARATTSCLGPLGYGHPKEVLAQANPCERFLEDTLQRTDGAPGETRTPGLQVRSLTLCSD